MRTRLPLDKLAGVLLVVALHIAALWGLWAQRLLPAPRETATLFVDFIAPPPAVAELRKAASPSSKPEQPPSPQPRQLVAEAPATAPGEIAVSPAPTFSAAAAVESVPAGPVTLAAELAVSCPERTAPGYPAMSRRMGETGTTVLRVELDEQGQVADAQVATGSGYARLDAAALAAVKTWRCRPAQRNGQALRAVALQPFKFLLQGH